MKNSRRNFIKKTALGIGTIPALGFISKSNNSNVVEKEFSRLTSEQYISLGENSLFNQNNKRTATIKTLSECELGFLNNKDLFSICEKNYKVGYKLLKNLNEIITQNLIKTNHQILKNSNILYLQK